LIKSAVKKKLLQVVQQEYDLVCVNQGGMLDVTYKPFHSILPFLKKFVLVYHNYNEMESLSTARKRSLYKWCTAAKQNLIAAEKIYAVVHKIAGFELPNGHVLKNPITIPVKNEPTAWQAMNDNYTWVCIGQLDIRRKAQDVLIKSLSTQKWKQRNWQLYIHGGGDDEKILRELVIQLQLSDKIFLQGHTDNVEEVLLNAHLVLQVSHVDAMPLSVTEAMNMARPCIVSAVGDMPLWIQHGKQGFVVPEVTEAIIDKVLEEAWQQRENWEQMGIAAFNIFHQKYPQPYELYYEKLLTRLINN
jgi:glycosyltransferase involved in cell wall biosynthesis